MGIFDIFYRFPHTSMTGMNLDWVMRTLGEIRDMIATGKIGLPTGGLTGQTIRKKSDADFDVEWADSVNSVNSVNGQTGDVVLTAIDVGAVDAEGAAAAAPVQSVNGQTGAVSLSYADVGALPDNYEPPAAPVQSVNGQTGAVNLSYGDVGAVNAVGAAAAAPVQSVNGMTGDVIVQGGGGWTQIAITPAATTLDIRALTDETLIIFEIQGSRTVADGGLLGTITDTDYIPSVGYFNYAPVFVGSTERLVRILVNPQGQLLIYDVGASAVAVSFGSDFFHIM